MFLFSGCRGYFPGGKAARVWRWRSLSSSGEVRNKWAYRYTPHPSPMVCTGTVSFNIVLYLYATSMSCDETKLY
jgi:hypothetical protein